MSEMDLPIGVPPFTKEPHAAIKTVDNSEAQVAVAAGDRIREIA